MYFFAQFWLRLTHSSKSHFLEQERKLVLFVTINLQQIKNEKQEKVYNGQDIKILKLAESGLTPLIIKIIVISKKNFYKDSLMLHNNDASQNK